jgi:hypothetical protein
VKPELIIIGGLPRSGTTLLQNILDSHPEIYGGPEFDRMPNIIDLRRKLHRSVDQQRIVAYTDKTRTDEALRHLVTSLLTPETGKRIRYISEKTPWNILVFTDLMELFPDAKLIHVLRNPKDVWKSMKQVATRARERNIQPPDFTRSIHVALNYMQTVYQQMHSLENIHSDRIITVQYEHLLSDTQLQIQGLCRFVGIDYKEDMLQYNHLTHPGETQMTSDGVWYNKSMFRGAETVGATKEIAESVTVEENLLLHGVLHQNEYLRAKGYRMEAEVSDSKKMKLQARLVQDYKQKHRQVPMPARFLS